MTERDMAVPLQGARPSIGFRSHGSAGLAIHRAPSGQGILFVLLLFLVPVSLLPSTRGFLFRLFPLPRAWWSDNLVFIFALCLLALRLMGAFPRPVARSTRRWYLFPVLALAAWQTISLLWDGRDWFMRSYSFMQSLLMVSAILSGVLLVSGFSDATRIRFGRGLTLFIAFVAAVYGGLSFVFPSWRPSYAWVDRTTRTLGFIRVFGPLGTATTLNFILLPALGFCVGMFFQRGVTRVFWGAMSLFFITMIVLTGSRGGLLSFISFCLLMLLSLRIRSIVYLAPTAAIIATIVFFVGVPERFRHMEDSSRSETYRTAIRLWVHNPQNVVFGAGHGAIYSKLHDDVYRATYGKSMFYLAEDQTPFGYTLRSSHSAILRCLAETGLVGFALAGIPLTWLLARLMRGRRQLPQAAWIRAKCILAGCLAMVPYMALEEFFICSFWVVVLWTAYAVIGAETMDDAHALA